MGLLINPWTRDSHLEILFFFIQTHWKHEIGALASRDTASKEH